MTIRTLMFDTPVHGNTAPLALSTRRSRRTPVQARGYGRHTVGPAALRVARRGADVSGRVVSALDDHAGSCACSPPGCVRTPGDRIGVAVCTDRGRLPRHRTGFRHYADRSR